MGLFHVSLRRLDRLRKLNTNQNLRLPATVQRKAVVLSLAAKGGPGAGKRASRGQRNSTLKENDGRCVFCGKKATEVDHSIPKSRNGDTTTKNLQPTCQHCNRQKGAKTSDEY
jgi:hypothetical protein